MPVPPIPILFFHPSPAAAYAARAGASGLLSAALARDLWKRVPAWIREDDLWKSFNDDSEKKEQHALPNRDEMASIAAVLQKLQALVITGYEKLGSEKRTLRRRKRMAVLAKATADGDYSVSHVKDRLQSGAIEAYETRKLLHKSTSECICHSTCCCCYQNTQMNSKQAISISPLEWHVALLAYIQLCNQMKTRYPSWRDESYQRYSYSSDEFHEFALRDQTCNDQSLSFLVADNHGYCKTPSSSDNGKCDSSVRYKKNKKQKLVHPKCKAEFCHQNGMDNCLQSKPITSSQIKELKTMLNYAIWAYEPDEEVLRSLLQNQSQTNPSGSHNECVKEQKVSAEKVEGFQLLLHRTTSYLDPSIDEKKKNNSPSSASEQMKSEKKQRKPPGRVGYYVAVSHRQQALLIGIKGTSTLEEILTDCCGQAVPFNLGYDPHYPQQSSKELCQGCSHSIHHIPTMRNKEYNTGESSIISDSSQDNEFSFLEIAFESDDCSQSNSIEVQLVHSCAVDESNEKIREELITFRNRTVNEIFHTLNKTISPKRNIVDAISLLTPAPAENVLLIPSNETNTSNDDIPEFHYLYQQNLSTSASSQFKDDILEICGIEMQPQRSAKLRGAHEGILHCAQQLLDEIIPLIEDYAVSKKYHVICTGHSLGAGTAALLAILIRGRYPSLVSTQKLDFSSSLQSSSILSNEWQRVKREQVRAYSFAPPPVLDHSSALACRHYVMSVVNNSDIIPRLSLTNLDILLTMLEAVRTRLIELGMNPNAYNKNEASNNFCEKPKSIVTSMVALYRKLSEGAEGSLLLDPTELRLVWNEAVADASVGENDIYWDKEGDHHLFVPGELLVMFKPWSSYTNEKSVLADENLGRGKDCEDGEQQSLQQNEKELLLYRAFWADGTAPMLKEFELGAGGSMLTDHLTASYYQAFESLEHQLHLQ